jgi:uncharacterized protein
MMMFMADGILPCGAALAGPRRYDAHPPTAATDDTMSLSMHSACAPIFVRTLGNMLGWLDKAQAHAEARKFDTANYLGLRLAPDMLPFVRQVQIASDSAKGCMARLAGVELPKWEDNEASFDELRARIRKTIDYVESFSPAQIDGSGGRTITVPTRSGEPRVFDGETFLKHFVLPNFHFHACAAYMLLRHSGVELGKADFLGR